jgi:penicillin-binding protein-related factor A (putative recombinase)
MSFTADDFKGTARASVIAQVNRGATMPEQKAKPEKPKRKPRAPGAGKTLERMVNDDQQAVRRSPVTLTFVRQEAKWIPDGRGGVKLIAQRGPCDAFGTFTINGLAVVFDMKECKNNTAFNAQESCVHQHQVDQLIRHGGSGAIAGLLILASKTGTLFWLNWTLLVKRKPTYPWQDLLAVGSLATGVAWKILFNEARQIGGVK